MSNMFVGRIIAAILASVMVSGGFLARGQSQSTGLSEAEKGDIVESLLQLETEAQASDFEKIRKISSDNIGSLSPARVAKHGFSLMEAGQIESLKKDNVVEYVVIRRIDLKDGIVVVKLSRVIEGRPCFGPPSSRERSFTYEFQNGSTEWVGRLVRKPLPFTFGRGLGTKP
jgi:hypothetical protein